MSELTIEQVKTLLSESTPGPWEYGPATNYEGYYIAPVGTLPTLAAVQGVSSGRTLEVVCHNFPGDTEANARLLAASPDLAALALSEHVRAEQAEAENERLRTALEWFADEDVWYGRPDGGGWLTPANTQGLARARAALSPVESQP